MSMIKYLGVLGFAILMLVVLLLTADGGAGTSLESLNTLVNQIEYELKAGTKPIDDIRAELASDDLDILLYNAEDVEVGTAQGMIASAPNYGFYRRGAQWFYTIQIDEAKGVEKIVFVSSLPLRPNGTPHMPRFIAYAGLFSVFVYIFTELLRHHSLFVTISKQIAENKYQDAPKNLTDLYEQITKRLQDIENEVREVNYNRSLDETRRDERMKNMMHDIKTPIAALHAFIEAYHDGLYTPDRLPQKMDLIERNVNHLLKLTEQYDTYLRYKSKRMSLDMRRVHLNRFNEKVLLALENDFAMLGRSIRLVISDFDCFLICDLTQIRRLMHILVENAHKYSNIDKPIIILCTVKNDVLNIAVKDYGMGIPYDSQKKIFDPFVKGDEARTAAAQSYGIGLYVARQIVNQHQGELRVESTPGKGSTFTVLLPIREVD